MVNFFKCCSCAVKNCKRYDEFDKGKLTYFDSRDCKNYKKLDVLKSPLLALAFLNSSKSALATIALLDRFNIKLSRYKFIKQ